MAVNAYGPPPSRGPAARGSSARRPGVNARGMAAHGLALWVNPAEGDEIDPEVWERAARLVLARAMKLAPEAEVRIWPATGAEHSGVGDTSWGGTPQEAADAGTNDSLSLADALADARSDARAAGNSSSSGQFTSAREGDLSGRGGRTETGRGGQTETGGSTAVEPVTLASRRSQLAVDLAAEVVLLDGEPVAFTGMEYKLLRYLVVNCSRAISREELQRFLESFDLPGAAFRSIDVYVGRVRRKLGSARHTVATVRGGGYQFVPGPYATVRGPAEYSI
ncbi:winged helix-turn-helix transcriptional regulator [Paenarthrobacter sp. MSM-2-10-13]|uniref:winged helix-turn-helix domain-containing protein n=1 Tax=Paenarthrobacter sp. MSM-2-10-13 TaxID=2717318 RepID=UPI0014210D8F|nr:winged helix-turn-helix domain-containing protein [Paenarthrobacter sp. MSM-2-10-13]NHW48212.1 winged helix-turn-helix transcriptional regulator [Paenarthrobacter sp. MSM-2-10-13]